MRDWKWRTRGLKQEARELKWNNGRLNQVQVILLSKNNKVIIISKWKTDQDIGNGAKNGEGVG